MSKEINKRLSALGVSEEKEDIIKDVGPIKYRLLREGEIIKFSDEWYDGRRWIIIDNNMDHIVDCKVYSNAIFRRVISEYERERKDMAVLLLNELREVYEKDSRDLMGEEVFDKIVDIMDKWGVSYKKMNNKCKVINGWAKGSFGKIIGISTGVKYIIKLDSGGIVYGWENEIEIYNG